MIQLFFRGFTIVALVSLNTRLISDGRWSAVIVATVLSAVWWANARTASQIDGVRAMLVYASGAGCGTALGLWLGGL